MKAYEDILGEMEEAYERESGHRAEDVSDTGLRIRVLAGELYRLHAKLAWLERQAFPHTATGEWLGRHGSQRGVERKKAAHASGVLTFSRYLPLSFDIVIPKGTVCALPGDKPIEYETTKDVTLPAGELNADVPASAVIGGADGNAAAGTINTMTTPTSGMNYVTNRAAFTGGRDAEADEEYRARVIAAYANTSNGTNAAYYRDIALKVDGVSAAGVVPRADGAGTVGVYIWGENAAPEDSTVAAVKKELERRREIGVEVSVQAATQKSIDVGIRCRLSSGADFNMAAESIKQAVKNYFAGLTVGSAVYLAEISRAALNAAPIVKLEFFPSTRDVSASQSVIPVLGTVTVEELS